MPKVRTVGDIKTNLLRPALTSHFEVTIPKPTDVADFNKFLKQNKYPDNLVLQNQLNLLCSETVLPGSNLATLELNNDHTGVTERHAYRRIYDDRIDFTFYVDALNYLPIQYFELWMKFIMGESVSGDVGVDDSNYFYRAKYPKKYMSQQGLTVTKFERTGKGNSYYGRTLIYKFVNAYPIAVTSMPVSYDASSLLKFTVSFSYMRYFIESLRGTTETSGSSSATKSPTGAVSGLTPEQLARANSITGQFNSEIIPGIDYGNFNTTGGVTLPSAQASGNTVTNVKTAFSGARLL